jgi:hypothetical protein
MEKIFSKNMDRSEIFQNEVESSVWYNAFSLSKWDGHNDEDAESHADKAVEQHREKNL